MEVAFIGALYNVEFATEVILPVDIGAGLRIGRGERLIDRLISSARQRRLGTLEVEFLKRQPFVYSKDAWLPEAELFDYLVRKINLVNQTIHWSWLLGDNAVNLDKAYALAKDQFGNDVIHSNFVAHVHTDARGNHRRQVVWDNEVINLVRMLNGVGDPPKIGPDNVQAGKPARNRLARALYFLSAARATSELGMKVTFYCSALEALFSTATSEISNQLAVRVSLFLTSDFQERIALFKRMKAAYSVRSKMIHGDIVKEDELLARISEECDDALRRALYRISNEPECSEIFALSGEKLDSEFTEASLGWEVAGIAINRTTSIDGGA